MTYNKPDLKQKLTIIHIQINDEYLISGNFSLDLQTKFVHFLGEYLWKP
jgi:hypothetical protein